MKNILMIAFHFPPVKGSSGIQRTLKFTQYLLDHGWKAHVLTVNPRAYEEVGGGQMGEIAEEVVVKRAFALNTAKHLSFKGRYVSWMALPDRWVSWCFGGVVSGIGLIFKQKPKVIFSTYPIATAHLIGLILHRLSGIPWVADFRDSMTEDDYPTNRRQRAVYRWIERQTIKHCTKAIFTTPSAVAMYAARYPAIPKSRWALIPNGFDEENFVFAENSKNYKKVLKAKNSEQIILLHSGILYPSERDPREFFKALAYLIHSGVVSAGKLKIILRATGHDNLHRELIIKNGLEEVVFLEHGVAYHDALVEMLTVDGLLIFQASNCNHQIPAKIYEYLRARKPIFALTDSEGDTAGVLKEAGVPYIVPLNDKGAIVKGMAEFLKKLQQGAIKPVDESIVSSHSRVSRTELLAELLSEIAGK